MNEQLKKRVQSFAWRLGMVLLVAGIDFMGENIGMFDMSPQVVTFVGLMAGEVSKYLNKVSV